MHLSVIAQTLELGQKDCLEPFILGIASKMLALLESLQVSLIALARVYERLNLLSFHINR